MKKPYIKPEMQYYDIAPECMLATSDPQQPIIDVSKEAIDHDNINDMEFLGRDNSNNNSHNIWDGNW